MGNDQSCCEQIDEKRGEIQSNINSIKYSNIIHKAGNGNNPSMRNVKNVFTNGGFQNDQKQSVQSKISINSSKMNNYVEQNQFVNFHVSQSQSSSHFDHQKPSRSLRQNHLSEKSSSSYKEQIHSFGLQNPEKHQLPKGNQINQQTLNYLKSSNASEKKFEDQHMIQKGTNSYQSSQIDERFEKFQNTPIRTNKSAAQTQITIKYLPIVKELIQREKPFATEFNLVPKSRIKTRRVNNGKDIYKGEFNYVLVQDIQFQIPHGYGVLAKENGNVLIGKFQNGSINGMGFYVFRDGSYYEGYMTNTKANDDKGEYHSLAMSYVGGFKDNLFHGEAREIGENYCFQGIYENHLKKQGILRWNSKYSQRSTNLAQKNQDYDKQHQELKLPEIRKYLGTQKYDFEYQGQFDTNQRFTGKGRLKDPNGEYVGEFNQGKKNGQGTYLFENKLKYVGSYKDNKKQGYGKLYNCDNTMAYEGFWKNNLPDGKGYSYGLENKPVKHEFIQGISKILAPQSQLDSLK